MTYIKFGTGKGYGKTTSLAIAEKWGEGVLELTDAQMATLGKTHKLDYTTKSYIEMTEEDFAKIANAKDERIRKSRIEGAKTKLASNDYKTVKMLPKVIRELIAKGVLEESETILEYLALDDEQQILRDRINNLGECF